MERTAVERSEFQQGLNRAQARMEWLSAAVSLDRMRDGIVIKEWPSRSSLVWAKLKHAADYCQTRAMEVA